MNTRTCLTFCLLMLLAFQGVSAQISPQSVGLLWTSASGATAGVFGCGPSPFTCVIDPINVAAGDMATLTIRGQLGGAYLLALSVGSLPCTSVPGILNQLLLDPTQVLLMAPGFMNQPTPILACPGGEAVIPLVWPAGIGGGQQFYLQAAATGPAGQLAFTNAIQITSI